jgi:hypothetical protein
MHTDHAKLLRFLKTGEDLDSLPLEKLIELGITDKQREMQVRRFVLTEGIEFSIRPFPVSYPEQHGGECFAQSLVLSINAEITFVEGFALSPTGQMAPHHAWCEDADGVVDCTWQNNGLAYLGIRFDSDYVYSRWRSVRGTFSLKEYSRLNDDGILGGRVCGWKQRTH